MRRLCALTVVMMAVVRADAQTSPIPIELKRVDLPRSLAELEAVCLGPHFDEVRTQEAISASTFQYVAEPRFVGKQWIQRRWRAPEALVTLSIPTDPAVIGMAMPQCELLMVGTTPLPRQQRLAATLPIVARYANATPTAHDYDLQIDWRVKGGNGFYMQVALFDQKPPVSDSLGYIVEVLSPTMHDKLRSRAAQ